MKKIIVFFENEQEMVHTMDKNGEYWIAYQQLNAEIQKQGGEFFIARDKESYLGNGGFSETWKIHDGELIETGKMQADTVYDKGNFPSDETVPVLNCAFINEICTDKWKTYEMFSEYCPKTFLVQSETELHNAFAALPGDIKVLKPINLQEGKGVFIGDTKYLLSVPKEYPLLVQEFLDSSEGVPGTEYKGIHDLRIALMNGDFCFSLLRTPPTGKLLANLAQGGSLAFLNEEEVPTSALELAHLVDQKFSKYPLRFFGVDVAFVNGTPKIIELNARLGLQNNARSPFAKQMKEQLAALLLSM